MPIDSRTWYARIGVFQSTKIVTQSNSFQKDNLNFTAQNIAFLYNEMSIKFFLVLFFLMGVLLKINFDNSWSVIAKCTKGPLMSTHSASENIFTKQLMELLLILGGDVEQNPGPEKEKSRITFCHWNLNGLMAHNFIKVSLLHTAAVTNDYDIICLTETFLDSSIDNDDDRISTSGYIFLRADHSSNAKRGGVCIYYKDHLLIIKRNDLCQLHECLVTEMRIGKKKCFFTCLYRSPSQTSDEFEDFCTDLNLLLSNINDLNSACSVITGDC